MKKCLSSLFLFISFGYNSYSQKRVTAYLEMQASVDALGNIYMNSAFRPKKLFTLADSLIDYTAINKVSLALREPSLVLNCLAKDGWQLVSVAHVMTDKDGRPNVPFLLYYFRRDFILDKE